MANGSVLWHIGVTIDGIGVWLDQQADREMVPGSDDCIFELVVVALKIVGGAAGLVYVL